MKSLQKVLHAPKKHWVGSGFPVHSIFNYVEHYDVLSPFLLLDYASATEFPPTTESRGVDRHPHRGFETVTIVYQGKLAHGDTAGNRGVIGPGDVQWMTAASGIVHEEFHEPKWASGGGTLQMVQLWVNLPAKFKMSTPKYQEILSATIPSVQIPGGTARIIAGTLYGTRGPAQTFTPVDLWDLRLKQGASLVLPIAEGHTLALLVLGGEITIGSEHAKETDIAVFERAETGAGFTAETDASILLLSGEPINEPVVGRGPFVMNTDREILEAMRDYQSGRFVTA